MLKTKKFRRLLAGLLAVLMLSICIPAMALAEGKDMESKYTVHFVDEDGDKIAEPVVVNMSWVEGQQLKLMDQLQSTIDSVKGYTFDYLSAWDYDIPYSEDAYVVEGNTEVTAHYTTNAPADMNSKYTVHFVDEAGKEIAQPVVVDMAWVEGQQLKLLDQLSSTLNSVEGYTFDYLTAWDYDIPYSEDAYVVEGNMDVTAHYTQNAQVDVNSKYTVNFVDEAGNKIAEPVVVNMGWVEGQELYLLTQLKDTLNSVEGYTFSYLTAWNGTEAYKGDELVVAGEYEVTAHYAKGQVDCDSKYTIHFVDENNEEFMEPVVVNMAWVSTQELNLMTQLDSTLKSVEDKGYTFKTLTAWNGTEPYEGDELVVPGEYELTAHCEKVKSQPSTTTNTNNNNTVTASSDDSSDEVVKASAPADNSTKILPQTGNQGVVSPVSFVVVLCAALAGAAVYLFAVRKKLN